jgi:2-polyprenyl-3-methyl-5-hydroxy-6-metoxy-1,4-benzoquinol methylase
MRKLTSRLLARLDPSPSASQRRRQVPLAPEAMAAVEIALRTDYFPTFATWRDDYLSTPAGRQDLDDHLYHRLAADRSIIIPWLAGALSLEGTTILEIGAGTGSSTVALAEQGARVTAVDVNARHLKVAKARCAALGLEAEFVSSNGSDVHEILGGRLFDMVVFFATLEHMTYEERLQAITNTFELVRPGGFWCVVEAPNRLWHFDSHTSGLPFFMWLPDELAMQYRRFSERVEFAEDDLSVQGTAPEVALARWGRGVSYHEFELALGPADTLAVHSSYQAYEHHRNPLRALLTRFTPSSRFQKFLRQASGRSLHEGFFEPYLNMIIRKPA